MTTPTHEPVTFGERPCASKTCWPWPTVSAEPLQDDAAYRERIAPGARFLDSLLDKEGVIYGVTTGYGDSCVVRCRCITSKPAASSVHLPRLRPGQTARRPATRAVLAARLRRCATACPGCAWNCWSACNCS
jgi:histidine ammonia-lyase